MTVMKRPSSDRDRGGDADPVGERNEHGWSPLYAAVFASDLDAVETLLSLGASADDTPPPLAAACWGSGDEATEPMIDALMAAGADAGRDDEHGWTLLHAAAMPYNHGPGYTSSDGPNVAAARALVRHGVSPDIAGPDGVTALMLVAADGALDAVEALLAAGADPARRDDQGRGALDHARDSQRQLTEVLATAPPETVDAVRRFKDQVEACVTRLATR
jgi:ankyrin repeat protein